MKPENIVIYIALGFAALSLGLRYLSSTVLSIFKGDTGGYAGRWAEEMNNASGVLTTPAGMSEREAIAIANQVHEHFGEPASSWIFQTPWEDEEAIYKTLIKLGPMEFDAVKDAYLQIFSRDLVGDLITYVSDEEEYFLPLKNKFGF